MKRKFIEQNFGRFVALLALLGVELYLGQEFIDSSVLQAGFVMGVILVAIPLALVLWIFNPVSVHFEWHWQMPWNRKVKEDKTRKLHEVAAGTDEKLSSRRLRPGAVAAS